MSALAGRLLEALVARGLTLAVAESLTGGLVHAALVAVPGASRALRGGVVAYATDVKSSLLGVDPVLLAARGPVDEDVARQMATGVVERLGADVGLATTGVAGPGAQDDVPAGTVWLAATLEGATRARGLRLAGDRDRVREQARDAVLELALELLEPGREQAGNKRCGPGVG